MHGNISLATMEMLNQCLVKNLQTKKEEVEIIDHYRFQSFGMVPNNEITTEMATHNMISMDFIRGV